MFIGHFGVGLAAKQIDRQPSLGTYLLAAQFIDLLWPVFLLFGLETVLIDPGNTAFTPLDFEYYPFSHSFLAVLIYGIIFGAVYFFIRKNLRASILLGFLVLSHWILDLLTHRPDLPLSFGDSAKVGFGLWNSVLLSILLEGAIFIAGVYFYLKSTKAKNKKGSIAFWGLIIFLALIYISNVFGPPPPAVEPIAYIGLAQWLIIGWSYWIDKNREAKYRQ